MYRQPRCRIYAYLCRASSAAELTLMTSVRHGRKKKEEYYDGPHYERELACGLMMPRSNFLTASLHLLCTFEMIGAAPREAPHGRRQPRRYIAKEASTSAISFRRHAAPPHEKRSAIAIMRCSDDADMALMIRPAHDAPYDSAAARATSSSES